MQCLQAGSLGVKDEFGGMRCGLASGRPTMAAFVLGADDNYDKKGHDSLPRPEFDSGTAQIQVRSVAACINLIAVNYISALLFVECNE